MLCQDIINILEKQSPTEYALSWDNVGLLVGRRDKDVKKIMLAVDATLDVCEKAVSDKVDMIITHHPMIFSGVKRINTDTAIGKKIMLLAKNDISCYAMHTNFDTIGGMAKLASNMLGLKELEVLEETMDGEGIGQIGCVECPVSLQELAENVKKQFGLKNVIIYGDTSKIIDRVAVCPGSGKSVIDISIKKNAECLITGDIGHHDGIDAVDEGLVIIDASHYGVEKIFMNYMRDYLSSICDGVEIQTADVGVPFVVV